MTPVFRRFRPADVAGAIEVYLDAVHNGTAPHYSEAERAAWAPRDGNYDHGEWTGRLADGRTWVAETGATLQGFATLTRAGHLDLLFVRPGAWGAGVAGALYDRLLDDARDLGLTRLTTDASHLARRFLERRGWTVEAEERALRHGVRITRFAMRLDDLHG